MKRLLLFVTVLCGLLTVSTQDLFRLSKSALAKGKPIPKWDVTFVSDGGYGSEVTQIFPGESDSTYRTVFGTGDVEVRPTDEDGFQTGDTLDNAFLLRADDLIGFRMGIKGSKKNRDRYQAVLPFPVNRAPGNGPWLELVEGDLDPDTQDMKEGAKVILHLNDSYELIGISRNNRGEPLGFISVGEIHYNPQ